MTNKYNNSNQLENKYNSYIANDIIGGGLGVVLRSHSEFYAHMLENEVGIAAKIGGMASKTTSFPGLVPVAGALMDGKYLKAAVVGVIPNIVSGIGYLTPLRNASGWIGEGLSFTLNFLWDFSENELHIGEWLYDITHRENTAINKQDIGFDISDFDPPLWQGTAEGLGSALKSLWDAIKSGPPTAPAGEYTYPHALPYWWQLGPPTSMTKPGDATGDDAAETDARGYEQEYLTKAEYEAHLREQLGLPEGAPLILTASVDELWNLSARLRPEAAQSSDASGIIHLSDQSKFPAEGEGPGPEGLDPGDYMADLEWLWQRGLLDEHGAYTQAGAEWLAGIMAQTKTENQEGAETGDQTGPESGGEGELAAAYSLDRKSVV